MTAMVSSMQEVHERASQEQQIWEPCDDVRAVLCPQEERRDSEESEKSESMDRCRWSCGRDW